MSLIADRASQSGIRFSRLPIGPDIRAAPAASFADKPRLELGQPDVIRPSVAADRCPMAALVIRAIDQETANAGRAHFGEGDFLLAWAWRHQSVPRSGRQIALWVGLGTRVRATADRGCWKMVILPQSSSCRQPLNECRHEFPLCILARSTGLCARMGCDASNP
jgi:hypothetical protein